MGLSPLEFAGGERRSRSHKKNSPLAAREEEFTGNSAHMSAK